MALNGLLVFILIGTIAEALCSIGCVSVGVGAISHEVDAYAAPMLRRRIALAGILGATLIFRLTAG